MTVIKKYYLFETIYSLALSFTKATFVIYFLSHKLSRLEIGLIFSVFNITVMIAEPITATYAEFFGRRRSLLVGILLKIVAALIFIFSTTLPYFLVAEILSGISLTFISGCIMAWAVDAFKESEVKKPLFEIFATCSKYKYSALIVGGLLGAFVSDLSVVLPWVLNASFFLIMFTIILFVMPNSGAKNWKKKKIDYNRVMSGYKVVIKDNCIMALIFSSFLSAFSLASIKLFWLPTVKQNLNLSISFLGWLWVGIALAGLLGTYFVRPYVKRFSYKLDALMMFSVFSTLFLLMMIFSINTWWTVIFYFLFEFGKPLYSTVKDDLLNYQISDDVRVTILSIQSLCIKLGTSLGLLVIGFIGDKLGNQMSWAISATVFFSNLFLYLAISHWMMKNSQKKVILATF